MAMQSHNFEFLRASNPELSDLGGFAEQYVHADPASSLVKLRSFGEQLTTQLYDHIRLPRPESDSFVDLLSNPAIYNSVPKVVLDRLHLLRRAGNRGAHGGKPAANEALACLQEAFNLAKWFAHSFLGFSLTAFPQFITPTQLLHVKETDKQRERQRLLEKLASKEAELQQLLQKLEASRKETEVASRTAEEIQSLFNTGKKAADALGFDEKTTRERLIDIDLVAAGWNLNSTDPLTAEVVKEADVKYQPTASGCGNADYLLQYDNGNPLAVIEAKKTSESEEKGKTQAQCYADGIQKADPNGIRPVIYCTNGYRTIMWNDAEQEPPREVYGYYSKDSLHYLHLKRTEGAALDTIPFPETINLRPYQQVGARRVLEKFAAKGRKALVVHATGTGKTVFAVALCEMLMRAKRAKRILFLCDRLELRRQAFNKFKELLPNEPRVYVTADTWQEREHSIYLATYPAMMRYYQSFDVGFFDVIFADESHRSIYNRYKPLLEYFDGLRIGLTATPKGEIHHNTYSLFDCKREEPTHFYEYEEARDENWLVPYRVEVFQTKFQREGIQYNKLSEKQKEAVDDTDDPTTIDFSASEVDKLVLNKDTNRLMLRNLMENGIREGTGSHPGKSIIFARNHNHAVLLEKVFNEMYPQYGGNFCRVIDTYDPRADKLIDDFKDINHRLTIAISVDMLDTGIDIPEVVNLVFARPVWSKVKFWQMIGRGTRLRRDLFGPGKDKTEFVIFDHWGNFEYFEEQYKPFNASVSKSLLQQLFEYRLELAEESLAKQDSNAFTLAIALLEQDLASLPETSVPVRQNSRELLTVRRAEVLRQFDAATVAVLRRDLAPLMQWRDLAQNRAAYEFDTLVARLQMEHLRQSADFVSLKDEMLNQVALLRVNLNQVQAKESWIQKVRGEAFWASVSVQSLEEVRLELRGIMHLKASVRPPRFEPLTLDIPEDESQIRAYTWQPQTAASSTEMLAYRERVEGVLQNLLKSSPTLQRIRSGQSVSQADLDALVSMVLVQDPLADLKMLYEFYPETAGHLDIAIRRIIGLDADSVRKVFDAFTKNHQLNSKQLNFMRMLENHIRRFGAIKVEELYQSPFTTLHTEGIDGVFDLTHADMILGMLRQLKLTPEVRPKA